MIDVSDHKNIKKFIEFFEDFSKIPHGSSNTKLIADYFVEFAKSRSLEYYRDESDNVIIRKPATKGYENRPGVIFQGHLDMVAEKKSDSPIDMEKDGLTLYRDGDFLKAEGTTLGADDGVALAYAMMVLDGEAEEHPDFEAVFTSDEEIGLLGAVALDPSKIKNRLLINIDSDEEGVFTVGCAGGVRSDISLPLVFENGSFDGYALSVSGFAGGHSGIEINNGRVNAVKFLAMLVDSLEEIRISDIKGGNADNAIPREAAITFSASEKSVARIQSVFERMKAEISEIEPCVKLKIERAQFSRAADIDCSRNLLSLLNELPSGVTAMSEDIEGLVETSLNLGILETENSGVAISFSVRSAKGEQKTKLCERIKEIAIKHGASYGERGAYPAWEYKRDSHLRDVMVRVYQNTYGEAPKVVIIHAGLECGIFSEKIPGLDCVSIGPSNFDIHTTEERLSLSSVERVWNYLKAVLKEI